VDLFQRLNGLDLFSGIGGNTIALNKWVKTICYCEQDIYAQGVLLSRMRDGSIEPAPIWNDVRTLTKNELASKIDIIVAGFPCQDLSVAGHMRGLKGKRSALFFEIIRLIEELKPAFVFLENVPAIRTRGLDVVLQELAKAGYDCRWTMLSASGVGANHKRDRWFLLAAHKEELANAEHSRSHGSETLGRGSKNANGSAQRKKKSVESERGDSPRVLRPVTGIGADSPSLRSQDSWKTEPSVGRVANGVPCTVERIRCLGNAVVPLQAKRAFEMMMGIL
jgi:DNA (cytosine-5)-methyltransferase 1